MAKKKKNLAKKLIANDKGAFTDKNANKISKKTNLKIGQVFKLNAKQDRKDDKTAATKNQFEAPEIKGLDSFDFKKKMAGKGEYRDMIQDIDAAYENNPYLNNYKGPQELKKTAEQRTKDFKFNREGAGSQLNKEGKLVRDSKGKKFKKAKAPEFESGYNYNELGKTFDSLRSNMGLSNQPGMNRAKSSLSSLSDKFKNNSNALRIPDRGNKDLKKSGKKIIGKIGL
tara:strand:- start:3883 stop:4563 length:681 start_codon:yes stop_codon:yes gene_type:complete